MFTAQSLRKTGLILIAGFLISGMINPSFSQSANYEAAKWNTWFIDNPQQLSVTAPPSAAKSKTELQTVKQRVSKLDEKKLAEIKYWDAGAPSYRWNQIGPSLI